MEDVWLLRNDKKMEDVWLLRNDKREGWDFQLGVRDGFSNKCWGF